MKRNQDKVSVKQSGVTTYTIMKTSGTPDWETVPVLPVSHVLWTEDTGIRAEGQICYDPGSLYIHMRAVETDIRAENTKPLSPVHEDSCLEFFFRREGIDHYFNFEINPNGCLCIQYGPCRTDRVNLVRKDAQEYFDIHTDRTSDGWEVFYRIPLEFIRLLYQNYEFTGDLMANMYKCGDQTVHEHYLSWAPIESETPNFHRPEFFGRVHFEP